MAPTADRRAVQNSLLRRVDWRFMLRTEERPRALNLASGRLRAAVPLMSVIETCPPVDLVVLARPTRRRLARARRALRPGGELYCEWRLPRPRGVARARRALARAGFDDVCVLWPGPRPGFTAPHFWLPLESPAAVRHVLARAAPPTAWQALVRHLWAALARLGLLAPLCVLAGSSREADADAEAEGRSWLLLTGGYRAINKVVGIRFDRSGEGGSQVVKFARIPESEQALRNEAESLRALAESHPAMPGAPRVLGTGRRAGQLAVAETAVSGSPLIGELRPASFPGLAAQMTDWLIELAEQRRSEPRSEWWSRLVESSLADFERDFGSIVPRAIPGQMRARLERLPELPIVFEHRDCAPWNVLLGADGHPALLDWESAEPRGLPALDLIYFLANCAFVLEGALEAGQTRESYRRLLDPLSPTGEVARESLTRYGAALDLSPAALPGLRLLCWAIHSRSDRRHLELEGRRPRREDGAPPFTGLVLEELTSGGAIHA